MRLFTIISASALAVLLAASPVRAQDRWTAEVRGGANVNSSQFSTVDLNTGIGFGGALGVRVLPDLFAYGGWDWQQGLMVADSKHTLGLEVGGGLEVALGGPWSLTPGLRYRRFEPTVRSGGVESSSTLSDVTFDVGMVLRF